MKKEDFNVGQTVYVYLIGNAARGKKTDEERIEEWEVVSIGRKYIKARKKGDMYGEERFDFTNGLQHERGKYSSEYELYTTKEELYKELLRRKMKKEIAYKISYEYVLNKLSYEEIKTIYDILKKYER